MPARRAHRPRPPSRSSHSFSRSCPTCREATFAQDVRRDLKPNFALLELLDALGEPMPTSSAPLTSCPEHPQVPLLLFCEDPRSGCSDVCCPMCASHGRHKGHDTKLVVEVAAARRGALAACHDAISGAALADAVIREQQRLATLQYTLTHSRAREVERVHAHVQTIVQQAHAAEALLIALVNARADEAELHAQARMAELDQLRADIESDTRRLGRAHSHDDAVFLRKATTAIKKHHELSESIEQYCAHDLESAEVHVTHLDRLRLVGLPTMATATSPLGPMPNEAPLVDFSAAVVQVPQHLRFASLSLRQQSSMRLLRTIDCGEDATPMGIAADDTRIFVSDAARNTITAYDASSASPLHSWGQTGSRPGDFRSVAGLTLSHENLFVADENNHRLQVFTTEGELKGSVGGFAGESPGRFHYPRSVCAWRDRIYVLDYFGHRVQVLDATTLALIEWWGGKGHAEGQLYRPNALAIEAHTGRIYVSDGGNARVQVFDATNHGRVLLAFGQPGEEAGEFDMPYGIAVWRGVVFVADYAQSRIQAFNRHGRFLSSLGATIPDAPHQQLFNRPTQICAHDNKLYVADSFNHRVQVLSLGDPAEQGSAEDEAPPESSAPNPILPEDGALPPADEQ